MGGRYREQIRSLTPRGIQRMCDGMNKKPLSRPHGRDFFLENGQKSIDRTVGL